MTRKKQLQKIETNDISFNDLPTFNKHYLEKLNEDVRYDLTVDPCNLYSFTQKEVEFIKNYIDFRNIPLVARLIGVSEEDAFTIFNNSNVKEEIDRLNIAIYMRNFNQKMLSIDAIGGWVSSILMDQVPEVDKVGTKDKLKFAQLLVEIQQLKKDTIDNPQIIDIDELNESVKDLSVKSIKQLIAASKEENDTAQTKEEIIEQINVDGTLSPEDIAALKSMSSSELLETLENLNKKEKEINESK